MGHIEQPLSAIRARQMVPWNGDGWSAAAENSGEIIARLPSSRTTPVSGPNSGYGSPIRPHVRASSRLAQKCAKLGNPYPRSGSGKRAGNCRHRRPQRAAQPVACHAPGALAPGTGRLTRARHPLGRKCRHRIAGTLFWATMDIFGQPDCRKTNRLLRDTSQI